MSNKVKRKIEKWSRPQKGQIYSFGSRLNEIVGDRKMKKIILFQEDETKWIDLRLGFGAILTINGQLIEFKDLFRPVFMNFQDFSRFFLNFVDFSTFLQTREALKIGLPCAPKMKMTHNANFLYRTLNRN